MVEIKTSIQYHHEARLTSRDGGSLNVLIRTFCREKQRDLQERICNALGKVIVYDDHIKFSRCEDKKTSYFGGHKTRAESFY